MSTPSNNLPGGAGSTAAPPLSRADIEGIVRELGLGTGTQVQQPITRQEIDRMVRSAIGESGSKADPETLRVIGDNFEQRERIRSLSALVTSLYAQMPPKDAVVLTGDDVAEWNEFKELGHKVADLKTALEEGEAAIERAAEFEMLETLGRIAEAEGYTAKEAAEVLENLLDGQEIEFETVKEPDPEDETKLVSVERPFIVTTDAKGVRSKERVSAFIEGKHKIYLPILRGSGEESDEGDGEQPSARASSSGSSSSTASTTGATPFPRTRTGSKADTRTDKNLAKKVLGGMYKPKQPQGGGSQQR